MTIKNFQIEYDAINRRNIFTNGDTINGRIILEASKETRIQSLVFIAKGKARVHFTEHYGILGKTNPERTEDYRHKQKYYRLKQYILKETRQNGREMIGKGRHVFPFSFKIPDSTFPSSFSSVFGQIIHTLKAKVKQSMMPTRKAKTHFTFVSIAEMNLPGITVSQRKSKEKHIALRSGVVSLEIYTRQMGYIPGEDLHVTAKITNLSNHSVKPKFVLDEKKTYNGGDYIKVDKHDILQEKADALKSMSGTKTVTKVFTIPRELPPSILVCPIIKLEYRLKVYLDITYAPYIVLKLPIVILPDLSDENLLPPSSSYICELLGTSYEPPTITRLQAIDPPPPYEAAASYPLCSSSDYTTML
ncbi:PREDICTED: arrestin domain-containing protein 3-like [Poecilia mexicana]|uniref:Arrestin C-terminal-like domain-containing protein n=1 Tax=Poecilia mexicana TaxID=48701 RepID=A0A3B3XMA1_9TELE|nr:PREDICTED: arrestin domain-containing protein 3-like [Poecilia mexicana]